MISWYHIIIIGACLLLLFLLWNEIVRENRSRIVWRVIASVVAVASLVGMALPMVDKRDTPGPVPGEVVLVTAGFHPDSLKNFLERKGENIPVYATGQAELHRLQNIPATLIGDVSFFSGQHAPGVVHVFGNGLTVDELQILDPVPISFHFPNPEPVIHSVHWTKKIHTGEDLIVQGMFDNHSPKEVKLFLRGLNTTVDSAVVPANDMQDFELQTVPKLIGRAVYALIAVSGKDTLENEPVPVEVEPADKLNILMLASSPGFENRFLKTWLSQHGYAITTLTAISKNKYDRQFLNTPKAMFGRISAAYLDQFDIVLANADELNSISSTELEMIRSAVEKKGMGLIVSSDSAENTHRFYSKPFPFFQAKHNGQQSFRLHAADSAAVFALHIDNPISIHYQEGTQVLLQDEQSNVFVSSSMYGSGKIIASTVHNTYSLVLSGNTRAYESFWSLLLQKAARKVNDEGSLHTLPAFTYPDEPLQLHLETNTDGLPQAQAGEDVIPLKQNRILPFKWQGVYWPVRAGWQSILSGQSLRYWSYIYNTGEWDKLVAAEKINDTKKYMSHHPIVSLQTSTLYKEDWMRRLKIYFLLAFIFCCGFLWVERKI